VYLTSNNLSSTSSGTQHYKYLLQYNLEWFDQGSPVKEMNGFVKELNMFHNYETEIITHKATDVAENLQLYRVVRFFCPRSLCTTMHLMLFSEHPPIYASCMTISGGRTKQHVIIGFGELAAVD